MRVAGKRVHLPVQCVVARAAARAARAWPIRLAMGHAHPAAMHRGRSCAVVSLRILPAELNRSPVEGFSAGLKDESNAFVWEIMIMGPPQTD